MSESNASCACYSIFALFSEAFSFNFLFVINICLIRYIFTLMDNLTVDSISFYLG